MQVPTSLFATFSIVSAFISLLASLKARQRSAPGSLTLSRLLLSMAVWSGLYSTRWMNISLDTKVLLFNLMYIAVAALPTLFLLFVLEFTHNATWLTTRKLLLLFIQPMATLLIVWTNKYHHLFSLSMKTVQENNFVVTDFTRGPWYFANVTYSFIVISIGFVLLGISALRSGPMYRYHYRLIFLGSILPWAGSIYTEYNFSTLNGLDLAPITFGLSGIIFVLAILRIRFMDLVPVARSHVIENMSDGILVLDTHDRIVDINPAMGTFLENKLASYMGKNASEIFTKWMGGPDSPWHEMETRVELNVLKDPSRYLDLRVTPLYDKNQVLNGRLMVFRDITERKQVEKRLRYVNERLQAQLVEIGLLQGKLREQAIRDPLTNLFNRRYLEETLEHELARATREGYPVCIMLIDLDHFKKVNDTYGHEAGDHVLKAIADTLSHETRRGDFACRYGGEEFVIVMPNINKDIAYERAEKLRNTLNSFHISYECYSLTITISMGIASYPMNGQTGEAILRAADKAMYAAKDAGRDHILSYDELQESHEVLED